VQTFYYKKSEIKENAEDLCKLFITGRVEAKEILKLYANFLLRDVWKLIRLTIYELYTLRS